MLLYTILYYCHWASDLSCFAVYLYLVEPYPIIITLLSCHRKSSSGKGEIATSANAAYKGVRRDSVGAGEGVYEDIDKVVRSVQGNYKLVTKPAAYEAFPISQGTTSDSVYATADESKKWVSNGLMKIPQCKTTSYLERSVLVTSLVVYMCSTCRSLYYRAEQSVVVIVVCDSILRYITFTFTVE